MCEHYISHGLCTDFPDWSIAAAGSETNVKIGYDYGRSVTGQDDQLEPDLSEEATNTESDQLVPDPQEERSMVATSAEVCIYLFFVSDCSNAIVWTFTLFCCLKSAICKCCVCFQALQELGLDAVDLVDDAPSLFESPDLSVSQDLSSSPDPSLSQPHSVSQHSEYSCYIVLSDLIHVGQNIQS